MELYSELDMNEDAFNNFLTKLQEVGLAEINEPFIYSKGLIKNLGDATVKRKEFKEFLAGGCQDNDKLQIVTNIIVKKPVSSSSENKPKKGHAEKCGELDLLGLFKDLEVVKAHEKFKQMRLKKGAVYTEAAEEMLVTKLNKLVKEFKGENKLKHAVDILNKSTFQGWTGIFKLNTDERGQEQKFSGFNNANNKTGANKEFGAKGN